MVFGEGQCLRKFRECCPFFLYNVRQNIKMTDIKHSHHYFDTERNKPHTETFKPSNDTLDTYLNKVVENEGNTPTHKEYDKVITLKVSNETFEAWELLQENWGDVLGYDNKSKIFEFAIIEALNVPIASLGGFTM